VRIGSIPEMTASPEVSVVMSVYNGATALRDSVRSVLAQDGVDLEFVIVDDGSTDASPEILAEMARIDGRIRTVRQDNQGLTRALVRGCALARGKYIARQDVGDLFLPGKLAQQRDLFAACPDAALVSCGTRFVGPAGEILYEVTSDAGDATADLLALDREKLRGPFGHGSVMFRRDLYERVGGYRADFYYAQDLDLWVRLAEVGTHRVLPGILFQAVFTPGSVSGVHRARQVELTSAIVDCARLRRSGQDEAPALARARAVGDGRAGVRPSDLADASYFIGACLRRRADPRARAYFRAALRAYPLHVRAAVRLLLG
jgi:glycosyltransferase involved in cell wall biosynthesis